MAERVGEQPQPFVEQDKGGIGTNHQNHRQTGNQSEDHFQRMMAVAGGDIHLDIRMMDLMQPPEPGPAVTRHMPSVQSQVVEQQKNQQFQNQREFHTIQQ